MEEYVICEKLPASNFQRIFRCRLFYYSFYNWNVRQTSSQFSRVSISFCNNKNEDSLEIKVRRSMGSTRHRKRWEAIYRYSRAVIPNPPTANRNLSVDQIVMDTQTEH
ncbi:UNVERIFIED_CONTAM: hypothetical protein NCL1_07807 [Trichonephila clavipes]